MLYIDSNYLCTDMLKLSIMECRYKSGETVYFLSWENTIEDATVVMKIAGFVTIRFTERTDGSRERESRLYPTREEAEAARK